MQTRAVIVSAAILLAGGPRLMPPAQSVATGARMPGAQASGEVTDVIIHWSAPDGTPLEGKLSVPSGATAPVPVVFYLHGAGPRNYDHAVRYRDSDGQIKATRYYDYYARELALNGMAFFRMSKRGVSSDSTGRNVVDRSVFAKATPTVLLEDYASGLDVLRRRREIDAARIILMGSSEGTRLAPQLAIRSPAGIVGLVLDSYQSDNQRNTVVWQNTVGPWRGVERLIPAAVGGSLSRAAYDDALKRDPTLASRLPFAAVDTDSNGVVTQAELTRLVRPRLDAILKAVDERNDEFLWQSLANLSSAYLLDGWDGEPTMAYLLKLQIPIAIFHGDMDNVTRVEGVREAEEAFRRAGKSNLKVRIYLGFDHDLGWTAAGAQGHGPLPYQDAFVQAALFARPR